MLAWGAFWYFMPGMDTLLPQVLQCLPAQLGPPVLSNPPGSPRAAPSMALLTRGKSTEAVSLAVVGAGFTTATALSPLERH